MKQINKVISLMAAAIFCGGLSAQTDIELITSSYFGGSGDESGGSLGRSSQTFALDDGGWVMGSTTTSFNYWVSGDALISSRPGPVAIGLTRFDQIGTPIYSTFLGGSSSDTFTSVAGLGDSIVVAGSTSSSDYPITQGAHDTLYPGTSVSVLTCLDPQGGLAWSTFFGREASSNTTTGVHVSSEKAVYLSGRSDDMELATPGTHIDVYPGEFASAPYLARFDRNGVLEWCTYYERGTHGISSSPDGTKIYAYSGTGNQDDVIPGAHQPEFGGGQSDAFLSCFDAETGTILWETYFGGEGDEWIGGITVAGDGLIYIAGITWSETAMATEGVHQEAHGGDADGFLACFDPEGQRVWGTYFGGDGFESAGIPRTRGEAVYLAGSATSSQDIVFGNPIEETMLGSAASYLAKFNRSEGDIEWATYIGSNQAGNCAQGYVDVLTDGKILMAGTTNGACSGFIIGNAWQPNLGGGDLDRWYAVYSDVTLSAVNHVKLKGFSLYPNPAAEVINLKTDDTWQEGGFAVHDISGRLVMNGALRTSETRIQVGDLPAGLYLLQIQTADGRTGVEKFIKTD